MNIEKIDKKIEDKEIKIAVNLILKAAISKDVEQYRKSLLEISPHILEKIFIWKNFQRCGLWARWPSETKSFIMTKYIGNGMFLNKLYADDLQRRGNIIYLLEGFMGGPYYDETTTVIKRLKKLLK